MKTTTTPQATTQPQEQKMKLTKQQAVFLRRLNLAHENAKDFSEGVARQERLDKYMEHLMEQGIDSKEITDLLY